MAASRAGVWRGASASFSFFSLPISMTDFERSFKAQNLIVDLIYGLAMFAQMFGHDGGISSSRSRPLKRSRPRPAEVGLIYLRQVGILQEPI